MGCTALPTSCLGTTDLAFLQFSPSHPGAQTELCIWAYSLLETISQLQILIIMNTKYSTAQKHFVRTAKRVLITNQNDTREGYSLLFWHILLWPKGVMGLHGAPSWMALQVVKDNSLQPGCLEQRYTWSNLPPRELVVQMGYASSPLRASGNPPGPAILKMVGQEIRAWGPSRQLHRRED